MLRPLKLSPKSADNHNSHRDKVAHAEAVEPAAEEALRLNLGQRLSSVKAARFFLIFVFMEICVVVFPQIDVVGIIIVVVDGALGRTYDQSEIQS